MEDNLNKIKIEAETDIANCGDISALENLRIKYLGRKGKLTEILRELGNLPVEQRPKIGKLANQVKNEITEKLNNKKLSLSEKSWKIEKFDVTLPGILPLVGRLHPVTQILNTIIEIFSRLGFSIATGPEIEIDYYNFEALNMPPEHPARDMQATFFLKDNFLLRTHTSAMQVRVMEKQKPPVMVIVPGKVYRRDDDISHIPMFHQVEGFLIDEQTNFSHLKGVLTNFVHQFFGEDIKLRFRPSFFPYTEPSAEVDIECVNCKGAGCRTCKNSGWLEILGCGMVHPAVLRTVGYNTEKYQGFAFGLGVERIAMLKYNIDDIRLFYTNDLRFLKQF